MANEQGNVINSWNIFNWVSSIWAPFQLWTTNYVGSWIDTVG